MAKRAGATASGLTVHKIKHYGWLPDLPDARDHMYAAPGAGVAAMPARF